MAPPNFPFLTKAVGTASSSSSRNGLDNRPWTESRFTSSSGTSRAAASGTFSSGSTAGNNISKVVDTEVSDFLQGKRISDSEVSIHAVGPYSAYASPSLRTEEETERWEWSPDIAEQETMDGAEVVAMLEIMDTQEVGMEGFLSTVGGVGDGEEVAEDPVEWLGVGGEYVEEVWGDVVKSKRKGREKEKGKVKGKGKGVMKVEMRSRL